MTTKEQDELAAAKRGEKYLEEISGDCDWCDNNGGSYVIGFHDGIAHERKRQGDEVGKLLEAMKNVSKQNYGLLNNWCGSWIKCSCGLNWAFGGNWNNLDPNGKCPSCKLNEAIKQYEDSRGEMK